MSSLDQLNGVPCDSGAGTASVGYGSSGAVSITCVTPTPTTTATSSGSATAIPNNTQSTPESMGGVACNQTAQASGDNLAGTAAWFYLTSISLCGSETFTFTLSGGSGDSLWLNGVKMTQGDGTVSVGSTWVPFTSIEVAGGTAGVTFYLRVSEA